MRILYSKALWGMKEGKTLREKFALSKEAGFDGIEASVIELDAGEIRDLCQEFDLYYVAQIFPLSVEDFREQYDKARDAGARRIVSQTGRDRWSFEEGDRFFREVLAVEKDMGQPVAHETHRHRMFYAPWTTARYLAEHPDLHIALDLSHWTCVCESMLDDMPEYVSLAISRAIHMHARVGYQEGPQVSDPSAPEWREHLLAFGKWWDEWKHYHKKAGVAELTVSPEFGPPMYMHTLPHTNQPVASHWDVNLWMRDWLRERWSQR